MEKRQISIGPHAIHVILQREILLAWLPRVVENPALVIPDGSEPRLVRAFGSVPEREGRVLRVIYAPGREEDPIRVVTAFFDRSMRGTVRGEV